MVKSMTKKLTSLLLILTVSVSMFAFSFTTANAGVLKEFGAEKLIETGMRVLAETTEELGEATGNEEFSEVCSFIANWVFSDGAEAAANKTKELCEEILERLVEINAEIKADTSVIESMIAQEAVNSANTSLNNQWQHDVDDVISKYNANIPLKKYETYMSDAVEYTDEKYSQSDRENKANENLNNLIDSFKYMYSGNKLDTATDVRDVIFYDSNMNRNFYKLIYELADNLSKENGSVANCAAQLAYDVFPFSHQQYTFVYNYMEKQLNKLVQVEMMYNEFLYQQGEYIESKQGKDSAEYSQYLKNQSDFYNLMNDSNSGVNKKMSDMLEQKLTVDNRYTFTLDDYMKPEDAVSVKMHINGYEDKVSMTTTNDGIEVVSKSNYIKENIYFNRVMIQENGNNNNVYYILDPTKLKGSDTLSLNAISMDQKWPLPRRPDIHIASCDYNNLIKDMSDGTNTFKCSSNIFKLFDTNAFRFAGSVPSKYLKDYLPDTSYGSSLVFMTPEFKNDNTSDAFSTTYEHFQVIEGDSPISGMSIDIKDYSAKEFQSQKYRYSVVLKNQNDEYKQKLTLNVPNSMQASVFDSKGIEIIGNTQNASKSVDVKSGEKITIKFKPEYNYKIDSLKCIRNNDGSSSDGITLFDSDDVNILSKDSEGYYTFDYVMPYSNSEFVLGAAYDDHGKNNVYEIRTPQDLVNFSNDINSGINIASTANLLADIDMTGYESSFKPVGNAQYSFNGTFNGNNHKIDNLNLTISSDYGGLFGHLNAATVRDVTVSGHYNIKGPYSYVGGIVGDLDGGNVSGLISYVNITNNGGETGHIGGVIGAIEYNEAKVDRCAYFGNLDLSNSTDCIGGVIGYTNGGGKISNCANYGSVKTSASGAYTGGVLGYVNNVGAKVQRCFNYGSVSNNGNTDYCGAIIGWAKSYSVFCISDNYYLDTSAKTPFGSKSQSGVTAVSKTADEFKSGMVTYLINNKVTDGTEAWYQNIDNGKTPDKYPLFDGGIVYGFEDINYYSNNPEKPKTPDAFDKDENGNLEIGTYNDLVKLSNLVRSDYRTYGSQNYILTANIVVDTANGDTKWTQGIGSVDENLPFNGTFDGNGYCIYGLNVNSPKYGGLFEYIGENGTVKNLTLIGCKFGSSSKIGGGIAAVNNGVIDHCLCAANVSSGTFKPTDNITIDSNSLISHIKADVCGGIAGKNNGKIIGTRSTAIVEGKECGGITAENNGVIYGCANNGKIGTSSSEISGGIVAINKNTVENSYNSANVYAKSNETKGSVAGVNGESNDKVIVKNVLYTTEKESAVGTSSAFTLDDTNKAFAKNTDLNSSSVTDMLNKSSDGSVEWTVKKDFNKGYPMIKGNFFKFSIKSAGNNISFAGNMHRDLKLKSALLNANDSEYASMKKALGKNEILQSYSMTLTDKSGNAISAELWCQDNFKVTVPVDSENVMYAEILQDGSVAYHKPDSVKDGVATFTVSAPSSFAIVKGSASNNSSVKTTNSSVTGASPIATGTEICTVFIAIGIVAGFAVLMLKRRNNNG